MKEKLVLTAFVFVILASALSGCCNRCKNQQPISSVPPATAGQESFVASAPDQSSTYTARNAIK